MEHGKSSAAASIRSARRRRFKEHRAGAHGSPSHVGHRTAIVGAACRFPGMSTNAPEEFFDVLEAGRTPPQPHDRWGHDAPVNSVRFMNDALEFDASFFGISDAEAAVMDPYQRVAIELAFDALVDAGLADPENPTTSMRGERVGVFVGQQQSDFASLNAASGATGPHILLGQSTSATANRISYVLGLTGPSVVMDTACSSSLVALSAAQRSISQGECESAVVLGISLLLHPHTTELLESMGALSRSGVSRPFDSSADGFVRAEGCGAIVITRWKPSLGSCHVLLRDVFTLHGGKSASFSSPSGTEQRALIRDLLRLTGVPASNIIAAVSHGTGTALGDPIEARALHDVLSVRRESASSDSSRALIPVAAIKGVIGHTEAASGIANIIASIGMIKKSRVFGIAHFNTLNPNIPEGVLSFSADPQPLLFHGQGEESAMIVQSFGMGGTISATLVEPCRSAENAVSLRSNSEGAKNLQNGCVMVFCGQGAQVAGMAAALYHSDDHFRAILDRLCEMLADHKVQRQKIKSLLLGDGDDVLLQEINNTKFAQVTLFAYEVALARVLIDRGLKVVGAVGHSLGEISAACVSGALSEQTACELVRVRSRLMASAPAQDGVMVAVRMSKDVAQRGLAGLEATSSQCAVAAVNGAESVVLSGPRTEVERWLQSLGSPRHRELTTSHAFHSPLMGVIDDTAREEFTRILAGNARDFVRFPVFSCRKVATNDTVELSSPEHWARHIQEPVDFVHGLRTALSSTTSVNFLEVTPKTTLSRLVHRELSPISASVRSISCVPPSVGEVSITSISDHIKSKFNEDVFGASALSLKYEKKHYGLPMEDLERSKENEAGKVVASRPALCSIEHVPHRSEFTLPDEPVRMKHVRELSDSGGSDSSNFFVVTFGDEDNPWDYVREIINASTRSLVVLLHTHSRMMSMHAFVQTLRLEEHSRRVMAVTSETSERTLHHNVRDAIGRALKSLEMGGVLEDFIFVDGVCQVYRAKHNILGPSTVSGLASPVRFDGVCVITGASGALGFEIAREILLRWEAPCLALMSRSQPDMEKLRSFNKSGTARIEHFPCDVCDLPEVQSAVKRARSMHSSGRIGFVVHCAGTLGNRSGRARDWDKNEWDVVAAPKVQGLENLDNAMKEDGAAVLAISSTSWLFGMANIAPYAVANGLLEEYCAARQASGLRTCSVSLHGIRNTGMARDRGGSTVLLEVQEVRSILRDLLVRLCSPGLHDEAPSSVMVIPSELPSSHSIPKQMAPLLSFLVPLPVVHRSMIRTRVDWTVRKTLRQLLTESDFSGSAPLGQLGMDSLSSQQFAANLAEELGVKVSSTIVFDESTRDGIVDRVVCDAFAAADVEARRGVSSLPQPVAASETVCIMGTACELPGGIGSVGQLWSAASKGECLVSQVPSIVRWSVEDAGRDEGDEVRVRIAHGSFVSRGELFDPSHFGISEADACGMDARQRLVLMLAESALVDAGLETDDQRRRFCIGVYVGIEGDTLTGGMGSHTTTPEHVDAMMDKVSRSASSTAGRVSFHLGLTGPCVAIDTACSSGLSAFHLARSAIERRECDVAIVAGVNLILTPGDSITAARGRMTSPTGACHTFDARADGYARAEGCCAVVLAAEVCSLSATPYARVLGSALRHDGRSSSFMAPSGAAQRALLSATLQSADVELSDLSYLEAHGTGTPLGDAVELEALGRVYRGGRPQQREKELVIGCVKGLLGHTEACSGLTGLLHTLAIGGTRRVPPICTLDTPTERSTLPSGIVLSIDRERSLESSQREALLSVSSFGYSGAIANAIVACMPRELPSSPWTRVFKNLRYVPHRTSNNWVSQWKSSWAALTWNATSTSRDGCIELPTDGAIGRVAVVGYESSKFVSLLQQDGVSVSQSIGDETEHVLVSVNCNDREISRMASACVLVSDTLKESCGQHVKSLIVFDNQTETGSICAEEGSSFIAAFMRSAVLEMPHDRPRVSVVHGTSANARALVRFIRWSANDANARGSFVFAGHNQVVRRSDVFSRTQVSSLIQASQRPISDPLPTTVCITGGLGAVGIVCAIAMANLGVKKILLASRRDEVDATRPDATQLLLHLRMLRDLPGITVETIKCDVSDPLECDKLLRMFSGDSKFGLIHCAGVSRDQLVGLVSKDAVEAMLAVKCSLPQAVVKAKNRPRFLLMFSSITSRIGRIGQSGYAAANAALESLSGELQRHNISCCTLALPAIQGIGMAACKRATQTSRYASPNALLHLIQCQVTEVIDSSSMGQIPPVMFLDDWSSMDTALRTQPPTLMESHTTESVSQWLRDQLKSFGVQLKFEDQGLMHAGMDSVLVSDFVSRISERYGIRCSPMDLFRAASLPKLTAFIVEVAQSMQQPAIDVSTEAGQLCLERRRGTFLCGVSVVAGGSICSVEDLWKTSREGPITPRSLVERFSAVPLEQEEADVRSRCERAALLDDSLWTLFPHRRFRLSRVEAELLDPRQRLALSVGWSALKDSGYSSVADLDGLRIGVFVGVETGPYQHAPPTRDVQRAMSSSVSSCAGRISHCFGLRGPCMTIDTGCSSGLVALDAAFSSLARRECDEAVVIGVNVIVNQLSSVICARAGMTSPEGRCFTFDERANGYLRGEGCCAVVLRSGGSTSPPPSAYGEINGVASAHDGRSSSFTAPSGEAQELLIKRTLACAGVSPADISYLEAHGSATRLGDPIELDAAVRVLREPSDSKAGGSLHVGCVKGVVGHCEAAAGLIGVVHALCVIQQRLAPINHGVTNINEHIASSLQGKRVEIIPTGGEVAPIDANGRDLYAAVSSFGFTGSIAHVILSPCSRPILSAAAYTEISSDVIPWDFEVAQGVTRAKLEHTPLACRGTREDISRRVMKIICSSLPDGRLPETASLSSSLIELGLDSIQATGVVETVAAELGVKMSSTDVFRYGTPLAIIDRVVTLADSSEQGGTASGDVQRGADAEMGRIDSAATLIVGMSCALPGVSSPGSLWDASMRGRVLPNTLGLSRWKAAVAGKNETEDTRKRASFGGIMDDSDMFDHGFFGLSPQEAASMEPRQRMVLSLAYAALADAGYEKSSMRGAKIGVFVAAQPLDSVAVSQGDESASVYEATADALSVLSGRISFLLDLRGPSLVIDTACSSGLTAVHYARCSLAHGECDAALVVGVNMILCPRASLACARSKMTSQSGRCFTFDSRADGYARAEGCCALVLKRMTSTSLEAYAAICGTACGQDGRSASLTAPNGFAQVQTMKDALANANIKPEEIDYVEAHGTGTPLGDPVEIASVIDALDLEHRNDGNELICGCIKQLAGHTEACAGLLGLLHGALTVYHRHFPGNRALENLNHRIAAMCQGRPLRIMNSSHQFATDGPMYACVNSFGFSGSLGCAVLSDAPVRKSAVPVLPWTALFPCATAYAVCENRTQCAAAVPMLHSRCILEPLPSTPTLPPRVTFEHIGDPSTDSSMLITKLRKLLRTQNCRAEDVQVLLVGQCHGEHSLVELCCRLSRALRENVSAGRHSLVVYWPCHGSDVLASMAVGVLYGCIRSIRLEMGKEADQGPWMRVLESDKAGGVPISQVFNELCTDGGRYDDVVYCGSDGQRNGIRVAEGGLTSYTPASQNITALQCTGTCVVTGATGGLGLMTVRSLLDLGYRSIAMLSRRGLPPTGSNAFLYDDLHRAAQTEQLNLRIFACDVGDRMAVNKVLADVRQQMGRITGIVHLAGVLGEGNTSAHECSIDDWTAVLQPKVIGAWNLHRCTEESGDELRLFFALSSSSAVLGAARRAPYAVANAMLDRLTSLRRHSGLPANTLQFHAVGGVGMAGSYDTDAYAGQFLCPYQAKAWLRCAIGAALSSKSKIVDNDLCAWGGAPGGLVLPNGVIGDGAVVPALRPLLGNVITAVVSEKESTETSNGPAISWERMEAAKRKEKLYALVTSAVHHVLSGTSAVISDDDSLADAGIDSVNATQLAQMLSSQVGVDVDSTLIYDHPTIAHVVKHLVEATHELSLGNELAEDRPEERISLVPSSQIIALVGAACSLPGGVESPGSMWDACMEALPKYSAVPSTRNWRRPSGVEDVTWNTAQLGGFAEPWELFDEEHFRIGKAEAERMDPRQRVVLSLAFHALKDAGYCTSTRSWVGSNRVGVFVAASPTGEQNDHGRATSSFDAPAQAFASLAGRVSFVLDLEGPAMVMDAACSSGLMCVLEAHASLIRGECDAAVVVGVNHIPGPTSSIACASSGLTSPSGTCTPFDARANGYVRAEGCVALVLERRNRAETGRRVPYAEFLGGCMAHDGRSASFTAPNGTAQQKLMQRTLDSAGVRMEEVCYLEAHATSTLLGDAVEVGAVSRALAQADETYQPWTVNSVKGVFGHLEAAAGVLSVLHSALVLSHARAPPICGLESLSGNVQKSARGRLNFPMRPTDLRRGDGRLVSLVSAFGFTGSICQLVMARWNTKRPWSREPWTSTYHCSVFRRSTPEVTVEPSTLPLSAGEGRCSDTSLKPAEDVGRERSDPDVVIRGILENLLGRSAADLERDALLLESLDSISAAHLCSEVGRCLTIPVKIGAVFEHETLGAFIDHVRELSRSAEPAVAATSMITARPSQKEERICKATATPNPTPLRTSTRGQTSLKSRDGMKVSVMFFGGPSADKAGQVDSSYDLVLDAARHCDNGLYEAIYVPERHAGDLGAAFSSPSLVLSAVAQVTSRLRIRSGSVVLPLYSSPLRVAEEWAALDVLSEGRVDMAFSWGWNPRDFVMCPRSFARRKDAFWRGLNAVRALWQGMQVSFLDGMGREQVVKLAQPPRSGSPLDVWISTSHNPASFWDAGAAGANIMTALFQCTLDDLGRCIEIYRESLKYHGFDPESRTVSLMFHTFVADSDAVATKIAAQPLADYLRIAIGVWNSSAFGTMSSGASEADMALFGARRFIRDASLIGSVDTCIRRVKAAKAVGVDEISCMLDFGIDPALVVQHLSKLDEVVRAAGSVQQASRTVVGLSSGTANPLKYHMPIGDASLGHRLFEQATIKSVSQQGDLLTAQMTLVNFKGSFPAGAYAVFYEGMQTCDAEDRASFEEYLLVSIASPPSDLPNLTILTRQAPNFPFTTWLAERAKPGDKVHVDMRCAHDCGNLRLDSNAVEHVFIAGGTGISVMRSLILEAHRRKREFSCLRLVQSWRGNAVDSVPCFAELSKCCESSLLALTGTVDAPKRSVLASGTTLVERRIAQNDLVSFLHSPSGPAGDRVFYICGPAPFQAAICRMLRDMGIGRSEIRLESSVYGVDLELAEYTVEVAPSNRFSEAPMTSLSRSGRVQPVQPAQSASIDPKVLPSFTSSVFSALSLFAEFEATAFRLIEQAAQGSADFSGLDSLLSLSQAAKGAQRSLLSGANAILSAPHSSQYAANQLEPAGDNSTRRRVVFIQGLGCVLPSGVTTPEAWWDVLCSGKSLISTVPETRWSSGEVDEIASNCELPASQRAAVDWGSFVSDPFALDTDLFPRGRIDDALVAEMDPQSALALRVVRDALIDAGLTMIQMDGERVGVFVGMTYSDRMIERPTGGGLTHGFCAALISHVFNWTGPSSVVNTACTSSMVALHHARHSLESGECDVAIIVGTQLALIPEVAVSIARAGVLSPSGVAAEFSSSADGMIRGEGAAAILLMTDDARERYGTQPTNAAVQLVDSAIGHKGASKVLRSPNPKAQRRLLEDLLDSSGIDASEITYVTAHGTSTPIGDMLEAEALLEVLRRDNPSAPQLLVDSHKWAVGNLEAAGGVLSLLTATLALERRRSHGLPHLRHSSLAEACQDSRLRFESYPQQLQGSRGEINAIVNSYAGSGIGACCVLRIETGALDSRPRTHARSGMGAVMRAHPLLLPSRVKSSPSRGISLIPEVPEHPKRLRILFLHGAALDGDVMQRILQLQHWNDLGAVDFVCPNAPFRCNSVARLYKGLTALELYDESRQYYSWGLAPSFLRENGAGFDTKAMEKRWRATTLPFLHRLMEEEHIDGVAGISEGALAASLLANERSSGRQPFAITVASAPLSCLVPAIRPAAKSVEAISAHVIGGSDEIVSVEQQQSVSSCFKDATIVNIANLGHAIPFSGLNGMRALKDFLSARLLEKLLR